jgi:hypothetical protein
MRFSVPCYDLAMATPLMPRKLVLVVVLMACGAVVNLATGAVVGAAIAAALLVGVLAGNDGVRTFLRGLAVVQILWSAITAFAVASETRTSSRVIALFVAFGAGVPAFYLWALGQPDVREWMFRKNFKLDDTL